MNHYRLTVAPRLDERSRVTGGHGHVLRREVVLRRSVSLLFAVMLLVASSPGAVSAFVAHDDSGDEPGYAAAEKVTAADCFDSPTDFRSSYQVDVRLERTDLVELSGTSPDGVVTHLVVPLPGWHAHPAEPDAGARAVGDAPAGGRRDTPVRIGFEPFDPAARKSRFPVHLVGVTSTGDEVSFGGPGDPFTVHAYAMPDGYLESDRLGFFPCVETVGRSPSTGVLVSILVSLGAGGIATVWFFRRRGAAL